jgi:ubiquinone/menaquinone biosynthesis C-methylase UbiE
MGEPPERGGLDVSESEDGRFRNVHFSLVTLTRRATMARSWSLFELGCGTGRYAARLLADTLPSDARYVGVDVSPKMVDLSRARLAPWRSRADVQLLDPPARSLPGEDGQFDRFVAT